MKRAAERGAAVPYHEPTSTDDDDDDLDDDVSRASLHDAVSSVSTEVASWPSTPSTPSSLWSTGRRATSPPPPLELSARTLLWSGSVSSPPTSPAPVYLPQSAGVDVKRQSLAALAESGDVDALKAALKVDASSVNDTDEVDHSMFIGRTLADTTRGRLQDRRNATYHTRRRLQ